ncbi:hypothetical protein [Enterobacter ludwigii]|uniref:hypothetical protein n=1 Tax=Enterobacter ludwigii TaxID=299767 RepID=UPI003975218B
MNNMPNFDIQNNLNTLQGGRFNPTNMPHSLYFRMGVSDVSAAAMTAAQEGRLIFNRLHGYSYCWFVTPEDKRTRPYFLDDLARLNWEGIHFAAHIPQSGEFNSMRAEAVQLFNHHLNRNYRNMNISVFVHR